MAETLNSQVDLVLGNVPQLVSEYYDAQEAYEALLKLHQAIEIVVDFYDTNAGLYVTLADAQTIVGDKTFSGATVFSSSPKLADAVNLILGTVTGSKIGESVTQKLGFWGKVPVVQPASASQTALTDSSGGVTDGTISAVTGSGDDTTINNNFAELHALLNSIRTALVDSGLIKGGA